MRNIKEGGYVDPSFSKISDHIEEILNLNNNFYQLTGSINFDEDIDNIIELFQFEKNKIVDEVKNMDTYIGNISVEEWFLLWNNRLNRIMKAIFKIYPF